jgi:DNA-binding MarR family transcriptional regulator
LQVLRNRTILESPAHDQRRFSGGFSVHISGFFSMTARPSELIRRTGQALNALYTAAHPDGLTLAQFTVLEMLKRHGQQTARSLCSLTGMDRTTIFGMLLRMTKAGLVAGGPVERQMTGRNPFAYRVAPAGKKAMRQAETALWNAEVQIMKTLTPPERSLFLNALRIVAYAGPRP